MLSLLKIQNLNKYKKHNILNKQNNGKLNKQNKHKTIQKILKNKIHSKKKIMNKIMKLRKKQMMMTGNAKIVSLKTK